MIMEKLDLKPEDWRRWFHIAKKNEVPSRAALEEKIKVLQQSIEYLEGENKPVPQSIRDQKTNFEKQLEKLA